MAKIITADYKKRHDGICYILKTENNGSAFYKVGHTRIGYDVRLRKMQNSCPTRLEAVSVIYGSEYHENQLHKLFSETRLHGEWFSDNPKIREFVEKNPIQKYHDAESAYLATLFS